MQSFNKLLVNPFKSATSPDPKRYFWAWINMMFNRMDKERLKLVGPDRLAAEWVLRNGGCVRYTSNPSILHCNYNSLPANTNIKIHIKEIEADNSGIMHLGFDHLENCTHLDRIVMKNCVYIDDYALEKLQLRKESLKTLEISKCRNITEHGLYQIKKLHNLEKLVIFDLPYVKNVENVENQLKEALKNCQFDLKIKVQ